jgi:hypothetical protein
LAKIHFGGSNLKASIEHVDNVIEMIKTTKKGLSIYKPKKKTQLPIKYSIGRLYWLFKESTSSNKDDKK